LAEKMVEDHWPWVLVFWVLNYFYFVCFGLCGLVVRVPGYRSRGPGFDYRRYQIFWEVVGLERCPLSLVSTIEELLGSNSSGSGLENREYGRGDPLRCPRDTLYPQKLALTSPTSGGRSVGIVRLRTKPTEFVLFFLFGQKFLFRTRHYLWDTLSMRTYVSKRLRWIMVSNEHSLLSAVSFVI
jgi:hypothetical protein